MKVKEANKELAEIRDTMRNMDKLLKLPEPERDELERRLGLNVSLWKMVDVSKAAMQAWVNDLQWRMENSQVMYKN